MEEEEEEEGKWRAEPVIELPCKWAGKGSGRLGLQGDGTHFAARLGMCFHIHLCKSIAMYLSLYIYMYTSMSKSIYLYRSIYLSISFYPYLYVSISISIPISIHRYLYLSMYINPVSRKYVTLSRPLIYSFVIWDTFLTI